MKLPKEIACLRIIAVFAGLLEESLDLSAMPSSTTVEEWHRQVIPSFLSPDSVV